MLMINKWLMLMVSCLFIYCFIFVAGYLFFKHLWIQLQTGISKEKEEKLGKVRTELETFWNDINQILEKAIDGKLLLQDVARLKFNVQKDPPIKSWFETELRVSIYLYTTSHIQTIIKLKASIQF